MCFTRPELCPDADAGEHAAVDPLNSFRLIGDRRTELACWESPLLLREIDLYRQVIAGP
ncbi:hypothetical protein EI42_03233 [Thermosporothrix hazakensis]|jgi:hypothetical protein|uniref:Uncharacterized protein n=1 Tax=Thermosporothrix hazakensis TaxID=644383 RepID=A0A326UJ73_THEHA|nr:hypothetical protein EI42_03233 [Thermosporothrix hazakensis]